MNAMYGPALAALLLSILVPSAWYLTSKSGAASSQARPLEVMFPLPDFALIERSREKVTLDTLAGKVWIADFIFTTCAGPCPMMTKRMSGLQAELADVPDLRLVTITVDPERDTPEQLADYASQFRAHPQRWLFLTGDREDIYRLSTDGFRLAAIVDDEGAGSTDHPILHSTRFVLVDRQGRIRGYYDGTSNDEVERLTADARRLAAEGA